MGQLKIRVLKNLRLWLLIFISGSSLLSCSAGHNYSKYNYFNGGEFYNKPLNIGATLFGDIIFVEPKKKTFSTFKKLKGLDYKDLLFTGHSYVEPLYDLMVFYKEERNNPINYDTMPRINLVLEDSLEGSVVFQKSYNGKSISVYLKPKNPKTSVFEDARQITNSARFDSSAVNDLTYTKVFNTYKNENNILYIRHKLNTAPVPPGIESEWIKFQYLATILANDPSYSDYSDIIGRFEKNKREKLKPILTEIIAKNPNLENTLEETISTIKVLSKDKKVVMLNEMHWLPKHRIFAAKLLQPLKDNGYGYLAVEAVNRDFVADLNKRGFPTKNSGYYTREPFFGWLLRKAIDLGFKIVAYDEFDTENREKAQAENLKKIFEKDANAKVFVYAGIDHILEHHPANKWMAAYFKEITGIDPLTIDQVELPSNDEGSVLLLPALSFPDTKKINTGVDFFFVNNIPPSYEVHFQGKECEELAVSLRDLPNVQDRELYASFYLWDEYEKYKSNAVPVLNKILEPGTEKIHLMLPGGNYKITIWNETNNIIFEDRIKINP